MKKILSAHQIREADQYTIQHEPISSIDLMERAAEAFVAKFTSLFPIQQTVRIFCGTGNNGGDGLAIGRLLEGEGWEVYTYVVGNPQNGSEDFKVNLDRTTMYAVIKETKDLPNIAPNELIIDGLFGTGLSRPIEGMAASTIDYLNDSEGTKIAIDLASGLYVDEAINCEDSIVKPDHTISFQVPKLPFFLPGMFAYVGEWHVVDIGLHTKFIDSVPTSFFLTEPSDSAELLPARKKFTHKNEVGRLLIISGSKGKMGATVLCTRAAFAAGAGLINVCTPKCGTQILQISIPEAMVIEDVDDSIITRIPQTGDRVAAGPGIGTAEKTTKAIEKWLKNTTNPILLDADALNILASRKSLLKLVPKESVLTPHPGEFRRLVGDWKDDFDKLVRLQQFCKKYELNVVLKGAYSAVCDTQGNIYFNSTGNPGLATAGSGDVLTGIVGAFLAQGVQPLDALRLGVFAHGLAGDMAVRELRKPFLMASEIISFLPKSITSLQELRSLD